MKILFNEFPLGTEIYSSRFKTGVYRVVEQLAGSLVAAAAAPSSDVEVFFHSLSYPWAARRYYQRHLRGRGTRFAAAAWQQAAAWQSYAVQKFCDRTADKRQFFWRALRWGLTRGHGRVLAASVQLNPRDLAAADIYHSPFQQIPPVVFQHPRLRRFTTVYDLLPITNPEWFEPVPIQVLQAVVAGFTEADFVTCISEATRAQLLEHAPRLQPERVFVTRLAAGDWCHREEDPTRIASVCAKIGLTRDTPYFLTLCTLEPRKNLEAVVRAFARLRQSNELGHEYRLVMVGTHGWKTEKLLAALDKAQHCRDAIILTGFVPDEDLSALYSGARAFVYVSRLEGFGLPPLEAMQCGVPVVTSNTSSLPEVVGDAGLMVAPDDLDELCAHLLRLAQDDNLHRELSESSLRRASEFSWRRFGAETLAAYRLAMKTC